MNPKNSSVDGYLRKSTLWQAEMTALREILLDSGLTEEIKWRHPCYTFENSNVVIMARFNNDARLTFVKGVLLKDPAGMLVKVGENTQVARKVAFTSVEQILRLKPAIKACLADAIAVEKSGAKAVVEKNPEPVPEELQARFKESPKLKKAFFALTPGRRRGYILHFTSAKQSATRASRIEKCVERILSRKGLND